MKNTRTLIVILITSLFGCNDEVSKENIALKSKLQGNWMWEEEWEEDVSGTNYSKFRRIELIFDHSSMSWKDSTITYTDIVKKDGYIKLKQGNNNVFYFYNNGESPISYGSALNYFFEQRPVNDILWVDVGNYYSGYYTIDAYYAIEDVVSQLSSGPQRTTGHTISSSSIIFSDNDTKAEFCDASFFTDSTCRVFNKID